MRLDWLKIDGFKNLKRFEINFDERELSTVLIGPNGTGKSNVIEALATIFRDLDLGQTTTFPYAIAYDCRGHRVEIDSGSDSTTKQPIFRIDNVKIGKNSVFAGQSGVSGSAEIGDGVVVAGQAGVVPNITIGDGAILSARSVATKPVPAGATMSGFPAREHAGWLKLNGFLARIPGMRGRIQELEKRIDELEKKGGK